MICVRSVRRAESAWSIAMRQARTSGLWMLQGSGRQGPSGGYGPGTSILSSASQGARGLSCWPLLERLLIDGLCESTSRISRAGARAVERDPSCAIPRESAHDGYVLILHRPGLQEIIYEILFHKLPVFKGKDDPYL